VGQLTARPNFETLARQVYADSFRFDAGVVQVVPDRFSGYGGAFKPAALVAMDAKTIRLAAPPVDGAANEALIEFLAKCLECGRRQLELARGETSQHKLVRVNGMDRANVAARLLRSGAPGFP
jgi:uncharacterized protein YggU (UPF0235/DUF167 family)